MNAPKNIQEVTTTSGKTFRVEQSCALAYLIFIRFGEDLALAASKWRAMLQNSCTDEAFAEMVRLGQTVAWTARLD